LTIARFTTNWRVGFRRTDEREDIGGMIAAPTFAIGGMIAAPTFAEAAMMALADGRPLL
jgi:hypothetical protein